MLDRLAEAVLDSGQDIFQSAHQLVHTLPLSEGLKVFEAKPGIFGFSIDLVRGAEILHTLCRRLTGPRQPDV
jgi:hypothetical protein